MEDILKRLESLEQYRIETEKWRVEQENTIEELFYSLVTLRSNQLSSATIIELACVEHFNISRRDFHVVDMGIYGDANAIPPEIRRVAHARKWHMSIMVNMLHETSYSLKKNYKAFYNDKKVFEHRPAYMGALNPRTQEDHENREHLMSIGAIIKRICAEEGVLDDRIDFI